MSLESGTFVQDLQQTNPPGTDKKKQGDDHLRLIKSVLKNTFPNGTRAQYFKRARSVNSGGNIIATDMEAFIAADSTPGSFGLTLPSLGAGDDGFTVVVMKIDGTVNTVTIAGTINFGTNYVLTRAFEAVRLMWMGSSWFAVRFRPNIVAGDIANNAVGAGQFRQSAALAVVGNPTNGVANVADIVAASDGLVLLRSGTTLVFGQVGTLGIANGAVDLAQLTGPGKAFSAQLLQVRDEQASGGGSQGSLTSSTWNTRRFTSKKIDDIGITLSANQVQLTVGTWYCRGHATFMAAPDMGAGGSCVGSAQLRLRNISDSTTLLTGDAWSWNGDAGGSWAANINWRLHIEGRFTIAGSTKNIELQNWVKNVSDVTFTGGDPISSGENECYADLQFWKVG